ncbi:fibroblast growth factor receptor homolog 1-like [Stylophora pistillata]|uniref:fibroblast growth factor receptor homolog 1-like n=1 Tax=Stylophora pistillata TaxID=50429 RepID=UPI000C041DFE|nr:fibroblast growth factor receptor homolog 1-like [Stylophora pistillata]
MAKELQTLIICGLFLCFSVQVHGNDECSNYSFLNESNRAQTFYRGKRSLCDRTLTTGWYRFGGEAGQQMPESCVDLRHCGTIVPGWLNGTHPMVEDGAVKRKVCFHSPSGNCCKWSTDVLVRNCGGFYVYKLKKTPQCDLRYCGNGSYSEQECSTYKLLNESNRAATYEPNTFMYLCDRALSGWYRFSGEAGFKMPEHCVSKKRCATFAPGWLSGAHPTLAEGAVERRVCFHWSTDLRGDCCLFSTFIKVRNCGKFYVYKLRPVLSCASRYCGNGLPSEESTTEPVTPHRTVDSRVSQIMSSSSQAGRMHTESTTDPVTPHRTVDNRVAQTTSSPTEAGRMNTTSTTVASAENTKSNRGQVMTRSWPTTNFTQSTLFTRELLSTESPLVEESASRIPFKIIWGFVGILGLAVFITFIVIFAKQIRRKRRKNLNKGKIVENDIHMAEVTTDIINHLRSLGRQFSTGQLDRPIPRAIIDEVLVVDNETYLEQMGSDRNWELPRERLKITEKKLGEGEFGVVRKGIYTRRDGQKLPVAVKMLKDNTDEKQRIGLIHELENLRKVGRHSNIVSLVGACSFEEPLYVVVEFVPGGSLDQILHDSRIPVRALDTNYVNIWSKLSERELLQIASDVSNGMRHLESKLCVHRDLAARNILIGKGLVAKVADFGMSRDISRDGVYIKCTEGKIPWLWMSLEGFRGIYTTMSDVWSFGVVLWEIVTLGERPYIGTTGIIELCSLLQDGLRLEKPPHCSKQL